MELLSGDTGLRDYCFFPAGRPACTCDRMQFAISSPSKREQSSCGNMDLQSSQSVGPYPKVMGTLEVLEHSQSSRLQFPDAL